ncbi:hypothetical protein BH11GEM1_BH11GEM1_25490 [soil metagenome]
MTILLTADELEARRAALNGDLAELAGGLRRELAPLIASAPEVPRDKAVLSREGGRCPVDGALLAFNPFDSRHICPQCGREAKGALHDRFRLYWYQMWLAERTVHAAVIGVLADDHECRALAVTLLDAFADQYLRYPNVDNVLGPSRPFFSTYLESVWLLQLVLALDLLETGAPSSAISTLGGRVRDRLVLPSAALIASFDERMSNRQVWNNAALMAAGRLTDDDGLVDKAIHGASGLHAHLSTALLSDGTWYEGENYHLFAHRGLWYGERIAAAAGRPLPVPLDRRYREGFASPFRTLLPDLTFPSRRDSQYAVSARQVRFAESCELGIAKQVDERLSSMLARLYDPAVPRGETGRSSSSADIERNRASVGLVRADLSWRTLLCALPVLPPLVAQPFGSDLLPAQGVGIIRRDRDALYVSLDYGHSGGGHGHPDRLNLTLVDRTRRWLEDPGTGSYVDPSLHWYRSTLAHNAPMVDGRSQPAVHGALLAFHDDERVGWVSASAELAPALTVCRSVVVLGDYLVDELTWGSTAEHEITLPMHGVQLAEALAMHPAPMHAEGTAPDGFAFLSHTARADGAVQGARLRGSAPEGGALDGWVFAGSTAALWTAEAPPPPGCLGPVPVALVRERGATGRFLSVWSWNGAIAAVSRSPDGIVVVRHDGSRHTHARREGGWTIAGVDTVEGTIQLRPVTAAPIDPADRTELATAPSLRVADGDLHRLPSVHELGEAHYRRSEPSWREAGEPTATVAITHASPEAVVVDVHVHASARRFVALSTDNPLDNEPASINGDSVQLYAIVDDRRSGLLLVPEGNTVSARAVDGWGSDLEVTAHWRPTASGYRLVAELHIESHATELSLEVVVNETVAGRQRRRGQLVLSGAAGEFVYLRGDRSDATRLLRYSLTHD